MSAFFISHGAPTLAIEDTEASRFLRGLGTSLPKPEVVVVASAHWLTDMPTVSTAIQPETIHDFGGFDEALYRIQYPAAGSPVCSQKTAALLNAEQDEKRGLDHGAWVPLSLVYPAADIPVFQLSIQPDKNPRHHFDMGRKLAALSAEGVLVLGSGSLTHNLRAVFRRESGSAEKAQAFADWMEEKLNDGAVDELLDYRVKAPYAAWNHPTDEHLLPLFVALGAGGGAKGKTLHRSMAMECLSMDCYGF